MQKLKEKIMTMLKNVKLGIEKKIKENIWSSVAILLVIGFAMGAYHSWKGL